MNELLPKAPPGAVEFHAEDHRGIVFTARRMEAGKPVIVSMHSGHLQHLNGQFFERYQTNNELHEGAQAGTALTRVVELVKAGIDRLVEKNVIYSGDLRRRFELN